MTKQTTVTRLIRQSIQLIRQSPPTYTAVIPDLIGDLRAFGLAPSPRRKAAKRMV